LQALAVERLLEFKLTAMSADVMSVDVCCWHKAYMVDPHRPVGRDQGQAFSTDVDVSGILAEKADVKEFLLVRSSAAISSTRLSATDDALPLISKVDPVEPLPRRRLLASI
jgi:hypothetical protein